MTGTKHSGKNSRARGAGKKAVSGTRPARSGRQVAAIAGEEHLRGKDRWRVLVETSSAWIWETDADVRHTYTNAFVTRCLGYLPEEFLGLNTLDLVHPDDHGLMKKVVQNAVTRKEGWHDQVLRWRHKDGSWKYIESNGTALFDEQGAFTGLCGVDRDVTEQLQAADALRRSEGKYRDLFENAMDAICIMGKDQNYLDVNRRAVEMFGYSREEFLSMNIRDMLPPDQLARSEKEFAKLTESGAYEEFTGKVRKKDGSYINVEVSSSAIVEQGLVVGSRDIIRDVTERRKTEELLRDSESRTRSIVESIPVGMHMYRLEPDGRLVFTGANPVADRILGVDNRIFVGKTIEEAFPPLAATEVPRRYREVVETGTPWQTENIEYRDNVITGAFEVHAFRTGPDTMVAAFEVITERKKAEIALRESEEKFRSIFGQLQDGILIADAETRSFVEANETMCRMLGYSREELLRLGLQDLHRPEDLPAVQRAFEQQLSGKPTLTAGIPMLRRDGTVFFADVNGAILQVAGRACLAGIFRDVTERRQQAQALAESETSYRTLFDSSTDGIFILDMQGRFLDANRTAYERLGYTREELLGMTIGQLDDPAFAPHVPERLRQIRERGVAVFESGHRRKDGTMMPVEVNSRLLDYRGQKVFYSVIRDITERKRAEDALRQSEERFRDLAQTLPLTIFELDLQGRLTYVNRAALEKFGYTQQDVEAGVNVMEVVAPQDRDRAGADMVRRISGGGPPTSEYLGLRKDGSTFPVMVASNPILQDGRPAGLRGIVMDLTERKQLEEERLKAQKLESLGTLAGGIAHDFNNLLQGIFGYISMAKMTIDQQEKSLAMLEQAEKALHQSVNLTSQLLTFSKGGKPVKTATDLHTVIENSVKFALSGSPVSYELSFGEGLSSVDADEGQIGQVVQNIMLNAEQAMPLGGRIEIQVRNVPPSQAAGLSLNAPDGLVNIVIRDQGTGIPPEHLPRIFDPYFTTKEKGSGLGLATSYSIIKNHDGMIDVSSELGKGSIFTIYLPASGQGAAADPWPASSSCLRTCRILVMDDEEIVRQVVYELLTGMGHRVDLAAHGEETVEKYKQASAAGSPFDIVILDLTIRGGMGGAEAMKRLREIDPGVKAIVSSGYSDDTVVANYRDHGFAAFLKKPYDLTSLQATLSELLA